MSLNVVSLKIPVRRQGERESRWDDDERGLDSLSSTRYSYYTSFTLRGLGVKLPLHEKRIQERFQATLVSIRISSSTLPVHSSLIMKIMRRILSSSRPTSLSILVIECFHCLLNDTILAWSLHTWVNLSSFPYFWRCKRNRDSCIILSETVFFGPILFSLFFLRLYNNLPDPLEKVKSMVGSTLCLPSSSLSLFFFLKLLFQKEQHAYFQGLQRSCIRGWYKM